MNTTHRLVCERFSEGFRGLLEITPDTGEDIVYLRERELEAQDCNYGQRWGPIQDRLKRLPDGDDESTESWICPGRDVLFDLVELTDSYSGARFVSRIEVLVAGKRVVRAVPHHLDADIDAGL